MKNNKERKIFLLIKELLASGVQKDEFLVQNNIKAPTFYRYILLMNIHLIV